MLDMENYPAIVNSEQIVCDLALNVRRQIVCDDRWLQLGEAVARDQETPLALFRLSTAGGYGGVQPVNLQHAVWAADVASVEFPSYELASTGNVYLLVGGFRRFLAGHLAGRREWQTRVYGDYTQVSDIPNSVLISVGMRSNGWGERMSAQDQYLAIRSLLGEGMAQKEIAERTQLSKGMVSRYAAVARLPHEIQLVLSRDELPPKMTISSLYSIALLDAPLRAFALSWPAVARDVGIEIGATGAGSGAGKSGGRKRDRPERKVSAGDSANTGPIRVVSVLSDMCADDSLWRSRRSTSGLRELLGVLEGGDSDALLRRLEHHLTRAGKDRLVRCLGGKDV